MLCLALDTAMDACSVALYESATGEMRFRQSEVIGKGHAERLMAMISEVMAEGCCEFTDLARIGVTIGPGSFTGIRVGLATARGLALASGKPAVGISTLDAIARSAPEAARTLVVLDARRDEVYAGLYDGNHVLISPPALMTLENAAVTATAADAVLYGSGAPLVAALINEEISRISGIAAFPDIADVAALTALAAADFEPPRPLYLRAPDAKPQTRGVVERASAIGA